MAWPGICEKMTTVTANVYCTLISGDGCRLLRNHVSVSCQPEHTQNKPAVRAITDGMGICEPTGLWGREQ